MNAGRVWAFAVAGLVWLGVITAAHAASIVPRTVEEMTAQADLVVRAAVIACHHEVDASGLPWTRSTLAVAQALKGAAFETVEVWQQGGPLPDGSIVVIPGDLVLDVGEDIVIFLSSGDGGRWYSHLLGWSAFRVIGDGPLARVVRNAGGADLYLAGPKPGVDGPGARPKPPVTLGQLLSRIEAAAGEAP